MSNIVDSSKLKSVDWISTVEKEIAGIDGQIYEATKRAVLEGHLNDGRLAQVQVIVTTDEYEFLESPTD